MKTLILPDVHTYHEIAQKVIDNVKADKVVLVGDMFDQFYDSVDSNVRNTNKTYAHSLFFLNLI